MPKFDFQSQFSVLKSSESAAAVCSTEESSGPQNLQVLIALKASKSVGVLKRWCPKDLRVRAPVLMHSLQMYTFYNWGTKLNKKHGHSDLLFALSAFGSLKNQSVFSKSQKPCLNHLLSGT